MQHMYKESFLQFFTGYERLYLLAIGDLSAKVGSGNCGL